MSEGAPPPASLRLDKWLWHARFARTRTLAQKLVLAGAVRVNKAPVRAASHPVRPGDVLTIAAGGTVRVARVLALGIRRGPAAEAQGLYEVLASPASAGGESGPAALATPRPDKRARRQAIALKGGVGPPGHE